MDVNKTVLLQTAYLGPVSYYAKLFHAPHVIIEAHENYNKQSYRNRCFIGTDRGPLALSIPVEKGYKIKCPINEIQISDHGDWRHQHEIALLSNYSNAPFYEYYIDDLLAIINHPYERLIDLNEALRTKMCELIGFTPNVSFSNDYIEAPSADVYKDYRERIHPKKDYLVEDPEFTANPYYQVYQERQPFMPNLSIVDLLFNMGPESILVLRDAIKPSIERK